MNEKGEIRIKEEKSRLPVDVRGSKTSVLKLPNNVNVLSLLDFDECSTSTPVCVVNAVSWNGGKFEIREDKKIDSKGSMHLGCTKSGNLLSHCNFIECLNVLVSPVSRTLVLGF